MEVDNRPSEKSEIVRKAPTRRDMKRNTHVFFHDKHLKTIPKVKDPTHALHAYFHNNGIVTIENLELMYNLTHLQLQWNNISRIQGLSKLYKLKKLYLGNNCIGVVEGLEGLRRLEELHVEKQDAGPDGLCFDPRSLVDIGPNLRLLNVSDNKIANVAWIKPLRRLEVLIARNNRLEDFQEVASELCTLFNLYNVDFSGNPMAKKHRYRETLVARCGQLKVLDGDTISGVSRTFLRGFDKAVRLKQLNERNKLPPNKEGADEFFELAMAAGPRSRSVYTLLPGPPHAAQPTVTHPSVLTTATDSSYTLVPRCFWRNRAHAQPAPERPPADAPLLGERSGLPPRAQAAEPGPRKSILKKPMPMKYI